VPAEAAMRPMTESKLVLVTRHTRLEELVQRFNTVGQAKFYVEHLGADFGDYLAEHERYQARKLEVAAALGRFGRVQGVEWRFLPNFVFGPEDVVVALGRDGLVANTMKYLDGQPLVGVNPDPRRWDGVLLPFTADDLGKIVPEVLMGRRPTRAVTMAEAALTDGQRLLGVNDIFVGPKSHVSALYSIRLGEREEQQSSSGVIVSTGLGSTGWYRSLVTGAAAIAGVAPDWQPAPWDADYLRFTVREPFPSRNSAATLVTGRIEAGTSLVLVSRMAEGGVIFSDGVESDFLTFNHGLEARIGVSGKRGQLVV